MDNKLTDRRFKDLPFRTHLTYDTVMRESAQWLTRVIQCSSTDDLFKHWQDLIHWPDHGLLTPRVVYIVSEQKTIYERTCHVETAQTTSQHCQGSLHSPIPTLWMSGSVSEVGCSQPSRSWSIEPLCDRQEHIDHSHKVTTAAIALALLVRCLELWNWGHIHIWQVFSAMFGYPLLVQVDSDGIASEMTTVRTSTPKQIPNTDCTLYGSLSFNRLTMLNNWV